jgi:hypothetical protein
MRQAVASEKTPIGMVGVGLRKKPDPAGGEPAVRVRTTGSAA